MTGIIEQRSIRALGVFAELLERRVHLARGGVTGQDDGEFELAQSRGHVLGVAAGIGERDIGIFVFGIADHQRDAALSGKRVADPECQYQATQQDKD